LGEGNSEPVDEDIELKFVKHKRRGVEGEADGAEKDDEEEGDEAS
jgi:hypothetical protein